MSESKCASCLEPIVEMPSIGFVHAGALVYRNGNYSHSATPHLWEAVKERMEARSQ